MRLLAFFVLLLLIGCTSAAEPGPAGAAKSDATTGGCEDYQWDMNREVDLLGAAPIAVAALKARADDARFTPLDRRLQVGLHPAAEVALLAPPGRAHDAAASHAGLIVLYVPRSGTYRISSDQRLWIDVVGPDGVVKSSRFAMQTGCAKLVKSVAFRLDPEIGYWIQLTGSPVREPMLLITLDR